MTLPQAREPAAPPTAPPLVLDHETALRLLREGTLEPEGRLVAASNFSLFCRLTVEAPEPTAPAGRLACVYKPIRGERPLDDFPHGTLANREVSAHALSQASGWDVVPPTVLRDGPYGPGMVQLWLTVDEARDPIELVNRRDPALRRIALFDVVVNNADRKVGHLLPLAGGAVHGVDHGITFHREPHLRTVLWSWRGQPLTEAELAALRTLRRQLGGPLGRTLGELLAPGEVAATARRIGALLRSGRFPLPDPDRPAIPWPPY